MKGCEDGQSRKNELRHLWIIVVALFVLALAFKRMTDERMGRRALESLIWLQSADGFHALRRIPHPREEKDPQVWLQIQPAPKEAEGEGKRVAASQSVQSAARPFP